jgi:YD repeat-containing protein
VATADGVNHAVFLTADGRVLIAGENSYGQWGDGTLGGSRPHALPVPGITTAVAIASGAYHCMALLADGTVRTWGYNAYGALGDGTTTNQPTPVSPVGLSGVTGIAAGWYHSIAIGAGGTVQAWGSNGNGQLGNGTTADAHVPTAVPGMANVVHASGGQYHTAVVHADGTMHAWGYNGFGQLGDGTTTSSLTPVVVVGVTGAVRTAVGTNHSLAVLGDGTVRAWGHNVSGQLGDGTTTDSLTAVTVSGINTATHPAVGDYFSMVRLSDGTVATWGDNTWGHLGNGTTTPPYSTTAGVIPGLAGIQSVSAQYVMSHAVGLTGSVVGWGYDVYYALGEGGGNRRLAPALLAGLDAAKQVSLGEAHSLALREDGALFGWGSNSYGQLGDGTTDWSLLPRLIRDVPLLSEVSAGGYHSVLLDTTGRVLTTGYNGHGQLGLGTTADSLVPVVVPGITTATSVTASYTSTYAVLADGSVRSWGNNSSGQLGNGSVGGASTSPTSVVGLTTAVRVAAGPTHALALLSDGTVVAWGDNSYGQFGDGTYTSSAAPVPVPGLSGVVSIAAGHYHSLAILSDGTARAWGYNANGQLGDGSTTWSTTPVAVSGLTGAVKAAAAYVSSYAVLGDGTVRAWGYNGYGNLGDGSTTDRHTPVAVAGLTMVTSLGPGTWTAAAVSLWRETTLTVADRTGAPGQTISLGATLVDDAAPVVLRTVNFTIDATPVGSGVTNGSGSAALAYLVPEALAVGGHAIAASFNGDEYYRPSADTGVLTVVKAPTTLYTIDRSGTITTNTILRQFDLMRTTDNALLAGRTITFKIDGTSVGTGVTNAGGDSTLTWTISNGPASRTILAEFAGDASHTGSSGTATLTALTWQTKMGGVNREGRITAYRILKAWLWKMDNSPVAGKSIAFKLDGTLLGADNTRPSGLAQVGYTIADGAGAGVRTILAEWAGDGGYVASSCTNTLTVSKASPYIWVMPRSVPVGGVARMYAYFRRLADYQKQEGKTVSFKVDGTWIADVVTLSGADAGIARYNYTTVEPAGAHTMRCEFAGDAWVDAGYGEANLTIY